MLKDILLTLRNKKGYTQADVAKLLCISRQAYNHYETGARIPPTDTLQELASAFGVSTDYLLGRDETPQKNTHLSDEDRHVLELFKEYPAMYELVEAIREMDAERQKDLLDFAQLHAHKYGQKEQK